MKNSNNTIGNRSRDPLSSSAVPQTTASPRAPVDLRIQNSDRIRRFLLSVMACLYLKYFSTLSHKGLDFRKMLLNIKCVF
jgi:hypothetical protein